MTIPFFTDKQIHKTILTLPFSRVCARLLEHFKLPSKHFEYLFSVPIITQATPPALMIYSGMVGLLIITYYIVLHGSDSSMHLK